MQNRLRTVALLLAATFATTPLCAQTTVVGPAGGKAVLQDIPYPEPGYTTKIMRSVVAPNGHAALHTHPCIESGYIVRGGGVLHVQGLPDRTMRPGDSTVVPPETPHWFINDDQPTEIVSTYVLERGKPQMRKLDTAASGPAPAPVPLHAPAPSDGGKGQTLLQSVAYPGPGHYTRITRTQVPANGRAPRHDHPGLETTYLLSGSVTLSVEGQPDREVHAGESFAIPPYTAHTIANGPAPAELLSTYVLEDGKPVMHVLQ